VNPRQNTVSSFASSFSDEDHFLFFGHYVIAVFYVFNDRLRFDNGLHKMLLFVKISNFKIKYTVRKTYGGRCYKCQVFNIGRYPALYEQ